MLDTTRVLKPLIYQTRKEHKLVRKDRENDDNVFDRNAFVYGTHLRCNAGFGFWQQAYASKAELNQENFKKAWTAMRFMTGEEGAKLNIRPNLLVVSPSNEWKANEILMKERLANGETNVLQNKVEMLVSPYLE